MCITMTFENADSLIFNNDMLHTPHGSLDGRCHLAAQSLVTDLCQDRGYERNHLQDTSLIFRNTAGAHIKLLILIQLPYSRAMRTLHVIGIDFQLRLGLSFRAMRNHQVMIRLVRLCLLRVRRHDYLPVELHVRMPGSDSIEKLV